MSTTLDPLDPLDFSSLLGEDELLLRSTVRRFVAEHIEPEIAHWYEDGYFPRQLIGELGKLGVLGMHLEGYGCAGTSSLMYGLACLELEAGDSGLRSFVSVQGSLAMFAIWKFGSEEQKTTWLPPMANGDAVGCFGLTEPDSGSDPASMRTSARRRGSDWVVNGTKMWITSGNLADVAVVWARTEEGIRGFLIPTSTPGFQANEIRHKLSLRASVTSELVLNDCVVPADAILPEARGLRGPLSCLNEARFGIIWGALGAARTCYETALSYSSERQQFGRPIAGYQLTQAKLVDMAIELGKGGLLAYQLARLKDLGSLSPEQVSIGKLNNVRHALAIARSSRTILGANGISLEYPVMRHMNNLESVATYEGTEEIHTLAIGAALTGQPAFR